MSEPIEMYLYELRNDDPARRIEAIKNLVTVAQALGEERSRDELIPYVNDCLDDEDHVLMAFSEEIPRFVEFVGGADFAHCLLPPLETLASNEDSKVREQSVQGIVQVAGVLSDSDVAIHVLPVALRLASADWFTPRTSACGVISSIYGRVSEEHQDTLKSSFFALCKDPTPMVRRSAFTGLCNFIPVLSKDIIVSDVVPLVNEMSKDNQDSVRLLCVETCIALASALDTEKNQESVRPIFIASAKDLSWRVRYMVALHFYQSTTLLNPEYDEELSKIFLDLLKDSEPEVRKAISSNIPGMSDYLPVEVIISDLLPCIRTLTQDNQLIVREALGLSITSIVEKLGEDDTKTHLLELIEVLLTDKESVVRLNVISTLPKLLSVVKINNVSRLILDAIEHLSSDAQWRIRLKIIEYIPNMSRQLGIEFFNENLLGLCLIWLEDSVYTVRMSAVENLKSLSQIFGLEWFLASVLPQIIEKSNSSVYLQRITSLFSIERFLEVVDEETALKFFEIVSSKLDDPVPNIRFNACRILNNFGESNCDLKALIPKLTELLDDTDPDVSFHAGQALKELL